MHTHRPTALKPGWLEALETAPPGSVHFIPDCPPVRIGWRTFFGFVWQMWRANRSAHRGRVKAKFEVTLPIPWW
tara:strand:+ start:50 stop:271 length:222 start_codon:yes stop_codon:yes gene_type:complete